MYHSNVEVSEKETVYSKKELTRILLNSSPTAISDVAIFKRINKMIAKGELSRVSNGLYVFSQRRRFSYSIESKDALGVLDLLQKRFDKSAKYIVYESTILNMFLNHLIANSTIIVEVEKDLLESTFWHLKENGYQNVLLNPSEHENYIYNPYDGSGIIVKAMVSQSPIDNKHHAITIEKLIVDIVADKTLNMFYEGAEVPSMVEDILSNYAVKFDSVRNYAKRRHCLDRFIDYAPDDLKGVFYDSARNIHQRQY